MSFLFEPNQVRDVRRSEISIGPRTGFFENLLASHREDSAINAPLSEANNMSEAQEERRKEISKIAGGRPFDEVIKPFYENDPAFDETDLEAPNREHDAIERYRATLKPEEQSRIMTMPQLRERAKEIALEHRAKAEDVRARASGWGAPAGRFLGGMTAQLTDPVIAATLPFGAASGGRILTASAIEAAIAGAVEIPAQLAVQNYRKRLGLEYGFGQGLQNVLFGAGGAGLFTASFRLAGKGWSKLTDRQVVKAVDDIYGDKMPADVRAARDHLEAEADHAEQNPFKDTPEGFEEHTRRAAEVQYALDQNEPVPDLPPVPDDISPGPRAAVSAEGLNEAVVAVDARNLIVDAGRFQFKSGGDASGVTDRLKGVDDWDPVKAGLAIFWQDKSGKIFIADGHQRRGHAVRVSNRTGAQIKMNGIMMREADGYSAHDVMVKAAAVNIAQGTGSIVDAAKVLRADPVIGIGLPPRSALVRDAAGVAKLSEEAFGMVVNKKVNPSYAAIVGRLAPNDKKIHAQILKTLAKVKPSNLIEAESIVRDMLDAPQVKSVSADLFGTSEKTQILFKERAIVLSAAASRIKKDRQAFSLLVREEARITDAGNKLKTDANARRAEEDAQLIQTLQKLARRKGQIADALAKAAKELADGKSQSGVVSGFIDALRRSQAGNGTSGSSVRGSGGSVQSRDAASGDLEGGRAKTADRQGLDQKSPQNTPEKASEDSIEPKKQGSQSQAPVRDASSVRTEGQNSLEFDDGPLGQASQAQADRLDAAVRRSIDEDGDIDVPVSVVDDAIETKKASELLDEVDADADFVSKVESCVTRGEKK